MVMAYILFVNPAILSNMFGPPGSPEALAFIPAAAAATALVAGVMTIAMGVIANTRSPWPPDSGSTARSPSGWS